MEHLRATLLRTRIARHGEENLAAPCAVAILDQLKRGGGPAATGA